MHASAALAVFTALFSFASAQGTLWIQNLCQEPAYLWHVNPNGPASSATIAPNGGYYTEPLSGSGVSDKLVLGDPNGLYDGAPQVDFQYTNDGTTCWWSLGQAVKTNPFGAIDVDPEQKGVPGFNCQEIRGNPDGRTYTCPQEDDILVTLCFG